jgi:hypothetical protein
MRCAGAGARGRDSPDRLPGRVTTAHALRRGPVWPGAAGGERWARRANATRNGTHGAALLARPFQGALTCPSPFSRIHPQQMNPEPGQGQAGGGAGTLQTAGPGARNVLKNDQNAKSPRLAPEALPKLDTGLATRDALHV